jgi:lipopolysaccharide transport system permease protein
LPWVPLVLVLVAVEMLFVTGLALMLSAAAVYFRDLQHLLGIVLQVWFFSAPIVYPPSLVREEIVETGWKITLYDLNPLVRFVESFRDVFYDLRFPPVGDMVYLVVVSGLTFALGMWVFGRLEGRLAEEL